MTHLSWILCVSGSEWRREVKGLSDGNVLLRTGHGAGAGMSSAPQPAKWLCPVLVAPALNTCTQTHLCVCVHASHWQGRYSLHKRVPSHSLMCSASHGRTGTGRGVPPLLVLVTRHIQPKAEVQSGCLWQRQNPCIRRALQASFLGPALSSSCCQVDSEVHTKIFTWPKVPRHTSGNSDWDNDF